MTALQIALFLSLPACALAQEAVMLSANGRASLEIVVSTNASSRVKAAAKVLADQLQRISGAGFTIATGNGKSGLALGCAEDFPALGFANELNAIGFARREQYLLRSHGRGLMILGATDLAVEHGVWDLLHRIGYRQFFPASNWEVVPKLQDLTITVNALESPSFFTRSIWYGFGASDFNSPSLEQWRTRNRARGGFTLKTGHAYRAIIKRHQAEFEAHPEYLGLRGGKRSSGKFCVSNPGLRELVARDAVEYLQKHPEADSYSVEPNDGGGWCECSACAALGTPSDRALTLANAAADAVVARWPDKYAAFYAYNHHASPPAISAKENVLVSVATALTRSRAAPEDLLTAWRAKGVRNLGVREYYAVNTWDRGRPGRSRGADLAYLRGSIPRFHGLGVRFITAESSDNWGSTGLGYYIAARLMWDIREADNVERLVDDFLDRAFGKARAPMAEFYGVLSSGGKPRTDAALLNHLYGLLAEAAAMSDDAGVRARLDDLLLYVRYVELYNNYRKAILARQEAFEHVLKHAYRMRDRGMVDVKPLFTDVAKRDWLIRLPAEADWKVPEPRNPLKSSLPFSRSELDALLARGGENAP